MAKGDYNMNEILIRIEKQLGRMEHELTGVREEMASMNKRLMQVEIDTKATRQMLTGMELRLTERIDGIQNKNAANTQEICSLQAQLDQQNKIDRKWASATIKRIDAV